MQQIPVKVFCLLNHTLTQNQEYEIDLLFHTQQIIYPQQSIKELWSNLPVTKLISKKHIDTIIEWLNEHNAHKGDAIIIQGEFGHTFALIDYLLKKEMIPLHAVTKRVATEKYNGEKVERHYIFEHQCFREYSYYDTLT